VLPIRRIFTPLHPTLAQIWHARIKLAGETIRGTLWEDLSPDERANRRMVQDQRFGNAILRHALPMQFPHLTVSRIPPFATPLNVLGIARREQGDWPMRGHYTGQSLAENPLGASSVRTEEPAGTPRELDCHTLPRQICHRAGRVAMHATRWVVAARTLCGRLSHVDDQDHQGIRRDHTLYSEYLLVSKQRGYVHINYYSWPNRRHQKRGRTSFLKLSCSYGGAGSPRLAHHWALREHMTYQTSVRAKGWPACGP
jgi:hypothetical protein